MHAHTHTLAPPDPSFSDAGRFRRPKQIGLHRLGLGFVTREDQEALMDALDAEGSGSVRYTDFASFFMDADPWFSTDTDLAERYCTCMSFGMLEC